MLVKGCRALLANFSLFDDAEDFDNEILIQVAYTPVKKAHKLINLLV